MPGAVRRPVRVLAHDEGTAMLTATKKHKRVLDERHHDHSAYIREGLNLTKHVVRELVAFCRSNNVEAIACSGVSGLLVAPIIALELQVPLIVVRKTGESSHAGGRKVECTAAFTDYLIIDDFVGNGDTVSYIQKRIRETDKHATCIGVVQYKRWAEERGSEYPVLWNCDVEDSPWPQHCIRNLFANSEVS